MIHGLMMRLHRDESGMAMMIAVVLSAVTATLVITSLTVASQTDTSTTRGREWVQALHVAESGVEQAIAKVQQTSGSYAGTLTGVTDQGSYRTTVVKLARNTYQVDSTGGVRSTFDGTKWVDDRLGAHRSLRVTLAPPASFKNALFSYTTVATKNNDVITGDVWANQNVIVDQNAIVHGSVTAATGYVILDNGSTVDGNAWSGGFNASTNYAIHVSTNATVSGNAKASVVNPPDPITCGGAGNENYQIRLESGAQIAGTAQTWGSLTGPGTVGGTVTNNSCSASAVPMPMPVFTYSTLNYDPATLHEYGTPGSSSPTAVADFQTYLAANGSALQGTFYVNQSAPVNQDNRIDLSNAVVTGDLTIVSNAPIFTNGTTDNTTDAIALLASTYQPPTATTCDVNNDNSECAIHLKNNFATSGATAVLVYAPYGPVAVKNNALQSGAVYADSIEIKNNQSITYDPRVERLAGFGPVTLEIVKWLEMKA